jgi:hypothetical protein
VCKSKYEVVGVGSVFEIDCVQVTDAGGLRSSLWAWALGRNSQKYL